MEKILKQILGKRWGYQVGLGTTTVIFTSADVINNCILYETPWDASRPNFGSFCYSQMLYSNGMLVPVRTSFNLRRRRDDVKLIYINLKLIHYTLYSKFDCPGAHQNLSLLVANAHDCEAG